ncbi:hypothetical protein EDB81DRAFT_877784 [Dactylonectria macrodidyma]|uniref:Uncharacterized protein n=1 Tax=Dactylonectria macrodidyma TaxID=307937 RepID=A0A9P9JJF7_9HYPO|nr:hypothetical protein EDB81DRAFT_877784 [Dactylonectria macrodidyma]
MILTDEGFFISLEGMLTIIAVFCLYIEHSGLVINEVHEVLGLLSDGSVGELRERSEFVTPLYRREPAQAITILSALRRLAVAKQTPVTRVASEGSLSAFPTDSTTASRPLSRKKSPKGHQKMVKLIDKVLKMPSKKARAISDAVADLRKFLDAFDQEQTYNQQLHGFFSAAPNVKKGLNQREVEWLYRFDNLVSKETERPGSQHLIKEFNKGI